MLSDHPLVRTEGVITEELDGQLLVYDTESNLAHALDGDAITVWRACDGHTDIHTLATRCPIGEDDVRAILARLQELGLLATPEDDQAGDTRRSALRKITVAGAGLAAIPTISSILVPTAAQAQSGQPCNFNSDCPSNEACVGATLNGPGTCQGLGPNGCTPSGACSRTDNGGDCCNGFDGPDPYCPVARQTHPGTGPQRCL